MPMFSLKPDAIKQNSTQLYFIFAEQVARLRQMILRMKRKCGMNRGKRSRIPSAKQDTCRKHAQNTRRKSE